jgi:hypothetical protein
MGEVLPSEEQISHSRKKESLFLGSAKGAEEHARP